MEALAPQLSHNTKKAFKIAKKMCKRDQVKKDEVLTTPEMLEDYKKKPRHSKQIKKNQDGTACNIYCTLWKTYAKNKTRLIFDTFEIIMYVPNVYQQTQI